jgi:hypothetical protein
MLVQVNGRYAIALVLDGVVLCIVPVGVQAIPSGRYAAERRSLGATACGARSSG